MSTELLETCRGFKYIIEEIVRQICYLPEFREWLHRQKHAGIRTALFCVVTQRVVAISYRRLGTTCRFKTRPDKIVWKCQQEVPLTTRCVIMKERSVLIYFAVEFGQVFGQAESTEDIFQYISNKMQFYTVYLYLETALHVLGVTSTHH
jgi:hypothetical protein